MSQTSSNETVEYIDAVNLEKIIGPSLTNYNNHIVDLILSVDGNKESILDFGAGCGILAKIIKKKVNKSPTCVEIDKNFINSLLRSDFEVVDDMSKVEKQFDLIYSSNVLEHIADDREIINVLKSKLKDEGKLVLYLPAFNFLYSELDKKVGHFRRYSKKTLIDIANETGFKIHKVFYADSIGFFGSLAIRIFGWNTSWGIGSKSSLIFYDKLIFPLSKFLDSLGFRYFFGKNIFISLKKK